MIKITQEQLVKRLGVETVEHLPMFKALSRLPELTSYGPWLAGGAIRRTLAGEALDSDFDFFFHSAEQHANFSSNLVQCGAVRRGQNDKNELFILPSTFEDIEGSYNKTKLPELKLQLIHFQYYDSLEAVLDSFDFTITQFGFDGTEISATDFALWDLARKRLVPHRITYATASMRRLLKYSQQGYTVCSGALSEFLSQVAGDPKIIEPEVLYID